MKMIKLAVPFSIAAAVGTAHAGTLNVSQDINFFGAMAAGYTYMTNNGADPTGHDQMAVHDFEFGVSSEIKDTGVGMIGAIGVRDYLSLANTMPTQTGSGWSGVGFDFGYATYKPMEALTIDTGVILTTIGAESAPSYLNGNLTRGFVWFSEPGAYPGIRATYTFGSMDIAAEVNNDTSQGNAAGATNFAVKFGGSGAGVDYSLTYYDAKDARNIVDVLLSSKVAGMGVTLDVNYYMFDSNMQPGKDKNATGVAFYVTPAFGSVEVPVRVEYLSDGDTGVYGVKSGYTFTVSPTIKYGDNAYVKAELGFVSSDNKIYSDKDGKAQDTQTIGAFQVGYTF